MDKKEFFKNIKECYDHGDKSGIKKVIETYISFVSQESASKDLAEYIYLNYTTYKADAMAGIMQIAIKLNPEIALLNYPENYLFKLTIIKGSVDLYECFIEDAIEPFLKEKNEDEQLEYYLELYLVAIKMNDHFFPQYVPCVKGMDFNGIFSHLEEKPGVSLIHTSDYEIIDDVVEKYNTIIGRRDIIADLEERT